MGEWYYGRRSAFGVRRSAFEKAEPTLPGSKGESLKSFDTRRLLQFFQTFGCAARSSL